MGLTHAPTTLAQLTNAGSGHKARLLLAPLLLAALLISPSASAQSVFQQIEAAALDFLWSLHAGASNEEDRIDIRVASLDPRIRLQACDEPLEVSQNGRGSTVGRIQLRVRCSGSLPWSKFIAAEVDVYSQVAVAAGDLPRGTLLSHEHIEFAERNLAQLRGTAARDASDLVGMSLKYPLTNGAVFSLERVERPKLVHRGDLVQLIARSDSLMIKQQGEALQDGAMGKLISVRNSSSRTVVQAEVIGKGQVQVSF